MSSSSCTLGRGGATRQPLPFYLTCDTGVTSMMMLRLALGPIADFVERDVVSAVIFYASRVWLSYQCSRSAYFEDSGLSHFVPFDLPIPSPVRRIFESCVRTRNAFEEPLYSRIYFYRVLILILRLYVPSFIRNRCRLSREDFVRLSKSYVYTYSRDRGARIRIGALR